MLVLSRKKGQAIRIAEGVTITVRAISGSRVILGFEAPSDVRIVRQELPLRDSQLTTLGSTHSESAVESMVQRCA